MIKIITMIIIIVTITIMKNDNENKNKKWELFNKNEYYLQNKEVIKKA